MDNYNSGGPACTEVPKIQQSVVERITGSHQSPSTPLTAGQTDSWTFCPPENSLWGFSSPSADPEAPSPSAAGPSLIPVPPPAAHTPPPSAAADRTICVFEAAQQSCCHINQVTIWTCLKEARQPGGRFHKALRASVINHWLKFRHYQQVESSACSEEQPL